MTKWLSQISDRTDRHRISTQDIGSQSAQKTMPVYEVLIPSKILIWIGFEKFTVFFFKKKTVISENFSVLFGFLQKYNYDNTMTRCYLVETTWLWIRGSYLGCQPAENSNLLQKAMQQFWVYFKWLVWYLKGV